MAAAATLAKAAAAFAATNIDDLVLLALWFSQARPGFGAPHIVAGQLLGFSALVALSLAGFAAGFFIAREWLGLLGLLPIALGIRAWRARDDGAAREARSAGTLGVAAVTFANGGDNIGVYAPLFATLDAAGLAATLAVFYALLLAWCAAGARLARQRQVAAMLARHGHRVVPVVLVALGVVILAEAGSWRLLG